MELVAFRPEEADLILGLPSLDSTSPDILSWYFDNFGNYTVGSGYCFRNRTLAVWMVQLFLHGCGFSGS
ncbi:hypothetical protein ACOSQ4_020932 [Xanthoceras sorbifolium]